MRQAVYQGCRKGVTQLRVFIASPGDVAAERSVIEQTIAGLNVVLAEHYDLVLEPVMWETHSHPAGGPDPQAAILSQTEGGYQLFIGVLWARFGSETPRAGSGTYEEFERAYKQYRADDQSIDLYVYFNTKPVSPELTSGPQLSKVQEFRKALQELGVYYRTYDGLDELQHLMWIHLLQFALQWVGRLRSGQVSLEEGKRTKEVLLDVPDSIGNISRQQVEEAIDAVSSAFAALHAAASRIVSRVNTHHRSLEFELEQLRLTRGLSGALLNRSEHAADRTAAAVRGIANDVEVSAPGFGRAYRRALERSEDAIKLLIATRAFDPEISSLVDELGGVAKGLAGDAENLSALSRLVAETPAWTPELSSARSAAMQAIDRAGQEIRRAEDVLSQSTATVLDLLTEPRD